MQRLLITWIWFLSICETGHWSSSHLTFHFIQNTFDSLQEEQPFWVQSKNELNGFLPTGRVLSFTVLHAAHTHVKWFRGKIHLVAVHCARIQGDCLIFYGTTFIDLFQYNNNELITTYSSQSVKWHRATLWLAQSRLWLGGGSSKLLTLKGFASIELSTGYSGVTDQVFWVHWGRWTVITWQ